MAISGSCVLECRTGGSDNNGGGFVTGASGTDYSQQDSAQFTLTTLSVVHTTTSQVNVAFGDATVDATWVGNLLQVTGGTATKEFFQITAVDVPNNRITCDRAIGTAAQTVAGAVGGALATPGMISKFWSVTDQRASGQITHVKSGTYTYTSSTASISGGRFSQGSSNTLLLIGYQTTRNDMGTKPIFSAGAVTTMTMLTMTGSNTTPQLVINIECDGNSNSGVNGFSLSDTVHANHCRAREFNALTTNTGFASGGSANAVESCEAISCGVGFSNLDLIAGCEAVTCNIGYQNTVRDWSTCHCIARGCTSHGFNTTVGVTHHAMHCTADENGGAGFRHTSAGGDFDSCLSTNNSTYGFDVAGTRTQMLHACATYNNTSGRSSNTPIDIDAIALSADPYVDQANNDLRPNNTVGGGAELRGAASGPPAQTLHSDVGALQHADPSATISVVTNTTVQAAPWRAVSC